MANSQDIGRRHGKWLLAHAAGLGVESGLEFLRTYFDANPGDIQDFILASKAFTKRDGSFKQGTPEPIIALIQSARQTLGGR